MSTSTPTKEITSKSAKWDDKTDSLLIESYKVVVSKPDMIAAGGKSLKSKGWKLILKKFNCTNNITEVNQLQSRWKRMKHDYSDYKWLVENFSGTGFFGLDDAKWAELDSIKRPSNLKLSRFRDSAFEYYDAIGEICGDAIADGKYIRGSRELESTPNKNNQLISEAEINTTEDENNCDDKTQQTTEKTVVTAAQKRAKLINEQHKKNRKRKELHDEERMKIKKSNAETLQTMSNTMNMMMQLFAHQNNLAHLLPQDGDE